MKKTITLVAMLLSFGTISFGKENEVSVHDTHFHPNNYKHHHKAKAAHKKRLKVETVREERVLSENYKTPFTKTTTTVYAIDDSTQKEILSVPKNYKMPMNTRRREK